jgi:hypothetical protein
MNTKFLLCECCVQAVSYDEYHYDDKQTYETKRGLAIVGEVGYLSFDGVVEPTYQQCEVCGLNDGYASYTLFDHPVVDVA